MSVATNTPISTSVPRPPTPCNRLAESDLLAALRRFQDPAGRERSGEALECALFNRGWIKAMDESWKDGALFKPWRITPAGRAWLAEHEAGQSAVSVAQEAALPVLARPAVSVERPVCTALAVVPCQALVPVARYERAWHEYRPYPGVQAIRQQMGRVRFWPLDIEFLHCEQGFPTPAAAHWFSEFMAAGEPLVPHNAFGMPKYAQPVWPRGNGRR